MPGGLTGQDLAERLRPKMPGLRVLYASGYSVDPAVHGLSGGEKIHFIEKPFSPQTLAEAVRACLDG
jgi:two-component system, cell cycle sensor histidine kinase and response regulator CckA